MMGNSFMKREQWSQQLAIWGLLLFLLIATVPFAHAQATAEATWDENPVGFNEFATLVITINGTLQAETIVPAIDGLTLHNRQIFYSTVQSGNTIEQQTKLTFIFQTTKTGTITIDPFAVQLGSGQRLSVEVAPLEVESATILQPTTPATTASPTDNQLTEKGYYLETEVDNSTPYRGEQVRYILRIYTPLDPFSWRPNALEWPTFVGFWDSKQSSQNVYSKEIDGSYYWVDEYSYFLFPTTVGKLKIPPTIVEYESGDRLQSSEVEVDVQPLPTPAPANFMGAVGNFTISSQISSLEIGADSQVDLNVMVTGSGNIDILPDPFWPTLDGWRLFENERNINSVLRDGQIIGRVDYSHSLIPTKSGTLTVPALEYHYFNPATEAYEVAQTESYQVKIIGTVNNTQFNPVNSAADKNNTLFKIYSAPEKLSAFRLPLTNQAWYWLCWLLPLLVVLGDTVWAVRNYLWKSRDRKRSNAYKAARSAIAAARKNVGAEVAVERILSNYLTEKFDQPFGGLTHTKREVLLQSLKIDGELIAQINTLFEQSENVRYNVHGEDDSADLLTTTEQIINTLEEKTK